MVRNRLSNWMVLLVLCCMVAPVLALDYVALEAVDQVKIYPVSDSVLTPFIALSEVSRDIQVYAFNPENLETIRLSENRNHYAGNEVSDSPSVDALGTKAVFHSWSTNWVAQVDGASVYLKEITTGELTLIQTHSKAPVIAPDGSYIVFEYDGNYWEKPYVVIHSLVTGTEDFVAYTSGGNSMGYHAPKLAISKDSRFIAFHTTFPIDYADVNARVDVYVYDTVARVFWRASEGGMNPVFSGNILTYDGGGPFLVTENGIGPVAIPMEPAPEPAPTMVEIEIKP